MKPVHYLINLPGFRTRRKLVVFESDDWGSIRMPSRDTYEELLKKNIRVDRLSYSRYDSLAGESDLTALFEVLQSVKDKNGNPAIITANTNVANPDFEKIKNSGFTEYHYEPFTETLKRYPEHAGSFELWKAGIDSRLFRPQFHGREHLNVTEWMKALQQNRGKVRLAFDYGMYDLSEDQSVSENTFVEALHFEDKTELDFQRESIVTGLNLFEELFGYRASSFIAPCYIWSSELDKTLAANGISSFQGNWFQYEPVSGTNRKFRRKFHYIGQKNKFNQVYTIRNAAFEPADSSSIDWIGLVIKQMESLFRLGKPTIINTHRLNYIGFIDPTNREKNLILLRRLLKEMVEKWPDIEFISSDELATIIFSKNN